MSSKPIRALETVPNPQPDRPYDVTIECPEFTCLCPRTGQPDFATIRVNYVPGDKIVELKSLKLYLAGYRDEGIFHEAAANRILDDLVAVLAPRWLEIEADFNVRGGIHTMVTVEYTDPEFTA